MGKTGLERETSKGGGNRWIREEKTEGISYKRLSKQEIEENCAGC